MVPAGAVSSLLSASSLEAVLVLAMPLEVPVAPWSAAPAIPTPEESSEAFEVDEGSAVEKIVDRTVDCSSEIVVTRADDFRPLELIDDEGDIVADRPSDNVVLYASSDRVMVSTSPSERVAKNRALRSIDEVESAELEVTEAKSMV